jgi:hypothetical protein
MAARRRERPRGVRVHSCSGAKADQEHRAAEEDSVGNPVLSQVDVLGELAQEPAVAQSAVVYVDLY